MLPEHEQCFQLQVSIIMFHQTEFTQWPQRGLRKSLLKTLGSVPEALESWSAGQTLKTAWGIEKGKFLFPFSMMDHY